MKLFYYTEKLNFGDLLSRALLIKLLGENISYANVSSCEVVAIGSLLDTFLVSRRKIFKRCIGLMKPRVKVWGTGFISEESIANRYLQRRCEILAVRGKISLDRLSMLRGDCFIHNDVVLGDPGLLSSCLVNSNEIEKRYKLGIIPHYIDKSVVYLNAVKNPNYKIIDVCQEPVDFLRDISSCQMIVSSAMHGLIAADSLGIPNIRMKLSNNVVGGDYKYNDYYSALGIYNHYCINVGNKFDWDSVTSIINNNYCVDREVVNSIKQKLLRSLRKLNI